MTRRVLGFDVGQARDFSALAGLERDPRTDGRVSRRYNGEGAWEVTEHTTDRLKLGYLKRFPLKTPYPVQVAEVKKLMLTPGIKDNTDLIVDMTGVGRPIVDMLRAEGLPCIPVTITGGAEETFDKTDGVWHVPKRILVSCLQVVMQQGRLRISKELPESELFRNELLAFKAKISVNANVSYEAWREAEHDDMVLAGALAVWWATRVPSSPVVTERPRDPMSEEHEEWEEQLLDQELEEEREEWRRWGLQ